MASARRRQAEPVKRHFSTHVARCLAEVAIFQVRATRAVARRLTLRVRLGAIGADKPAAVALMARLTRLRVGEHGREANASKKEHSPPVKQAPTPVYTAINRSLVLPNLNGYLRSRRDHNAAFCRAHAQQRTDSRPLPTVIPTSIRALSLTKPIGCGAFQHADQKRGQLSAKNFWRAPDNFACLFLYLYIYNI